MAQFSRAEAQQLVRCSPFLFSQPRAAARGLFEDFRFCQQNARFDKMHLHTAIYCFSCAALHSNVVATFVNTLTGIPLKHKLHNRCRCTWTFERRRYLGFKPCPKTLSLRHFLRTFPTTMLLRIPDACSSFKLTGRPAWQQVESDAQRDRTWMSFCNLSASGPCAIFAVLHMAAWQDLGWAT